MQPLRAVVNAAVSARQWLKSIAVKWRFDSRISEPIEVRSSDSSTNLKHVSHAEALAQKESSTSHQVDSLVVIDRSVQVPGNQNTNTPQPEQLVEELTDSDSDMETDETKIAVATSSITELAESRKPVSKKLLWVHRKGVRSRVIGQVLQRLNDWEAALEFFWWVSREAGCKHDTYTVNSLLLTLIKAGKVDEAFEFFSQGLPDGCQPDSLTVSTLVYGLTDSGQVQRACELCEQMTTSSKVVVYGRVLSTLIQTLCSSGNVRFALKLAREHTVDPEECIYTYSIVIHTLCKLKKLDAAWKLFYEVQDKGGSVDVYVYASLMHGLCRTGELRQACKLLEDMAGRGCKLDAVIYNTLIDGFCKARKVDQALELLTIMNSNGFNACVVTYTTLIDGLCKARDINRARTLLQEMVDRGCSPNVVTYSAIIDGLCKAKRMEEAIDVIKQMLSSGCEPDLITYNSLIHGFCISQKLLEAGWVLEELLEKGFVPNHITYTTLIIGHCRGKRFEKALSLLREMITKGSVCNLVVYIDLIYGFCEANCGYYASDCCQATDEVGGLYKLMEELVAQCYNSRGSLIIVFEGDSFYDELSRLDRVEQILDYMYHRGCVGEEERFMTIQDALSTIKRLKTPKLRSGDEMTR